MRTRIPVYAHSEQTRYPKRTKAPGVPLSDTSPLADATRQLLGGLREGTSSETAYDTAMVSRLRSDRDGRRPAFPATLQWLRRYQHADGSWGARYDTLHDRTVSTLAAVIRLAELPDGWARRAVEDGVRSLRNRVFDWDSGPHETVAFELIVPHLLAEAAELRLDLPYERFRPVLEMQDQKLQRLPLDRIYDQQTTIVHSLEILGSTLDRSRVTALRGANGSYGCSPSSTAHVLNYAADGGAERYLDRVVGVSLNGGVPTIYPFEIFERAWVLYNLTQLGVSLPGAAPLLEYLADSFTPEGLAMSREGLIADCDDTAMGLIVLGRAGRPVDGDVLRRYERDGWFACFPMERNTSVSVNARVLEALRVAGGPQSPRDRPQVRKLAEYLRGERCDGGYWRDKWHISPYYATTQVVLAATGIRDDLLDGTERWLLDTQRPDGSWGEYDGTSEETAYAMQALCALAPRSMHAVDVALRRGAAFLTERFDDTDYPELWIGKGLYTPHAIVRSAVISALLLARARGMT